MTQARSLELAARAGNPGATRVDETIGRAVGREVGATALLLPAVRKLGSTYAVVMRAIDPVNDRHLFTVSDRTSSKEGLFDLLDRLSEKARRELKEDPAELARNSIRLGEAMTRSVEAYQHYQAGVEAWWRDGQRAIALREQLRAVELDPQFALAHGELAWLYNHYQRGDLSEPHRKAAEDLEDRVPEKERTLQRLRRISRAGPPGRDVEATLQLAAEVAQRYPNDARVLYEVGKASGAVERPELQEATWRQAFELDPGAILLAFDLINLVGDRGHRSEAVPIARRAVSARRSAANLLLLGQELLGIGDDAGAGAAVREGLELDGGNGAGEDLAGCWVLDALGAGRECLPIWERTMASGPNEFERDAARRNLVLALAAQGRIREALRLSASVEEARRGNANFLMTLSEIGRPRLDAPEAVAWARRLKSRPWRRLNLARLGRLEEAERITADLGADDRDGQVDKWFEALALGARGRHEEAISLWRQIHEENVRAPDIDIRYSTTYHLAEALLEAGRPAEAVAVEAPKPYYRFDKPSDRAVASPRLALVRARALERLGRGADAARELDGILASWKEADDDLPLLVEARAMRARLVSSAR